MTQPTFLTGGNGAYIEGLYARYMENPTSVDASWQAFFADLDPETRALLSANGGGDFAGPSWARKDWPVAANGDWVNALDAGQPGNAILAKVEKAAPKLGAVSADEVRRAALDAIRALMLIRAYRVRGHLEANLDPLGLTPQQHHPELDPKTYGFEDADMDRPIFIDHVLGMETATVREIMDRLRRTYANSIGVEFMHIFEPEEKSWIQSRIEAADAEVKFTPEGKKAILQKLTEAEHFEKFCGIKYIGTKRFGLDGGEAMLPALEAIIKRGGALGVKEIVLGMPHRGRLNVLANVMLKPYQAIFHEFRGGSANPDDVEGSGDVKYHLGSSADRVFDGHKVHLSLTANPSHLEAVDPVVLGKVRAKTTMSGDLTRSSVMPLLLHGDAAFVGQGLVAECFGLMGLKGYRTGGTIHFVVNNQIGFTTSPKYSRSSPYPSDMAKMVQAPIFHVNGDDPEAVTFVAKIAAEFRQAFRKDVVIDMFCYRRHGHNESDEPSFTQPLMYREIANHPSTRTIYAKRLVEEGVMTQAETDQMVADFNASLEADFQAAQGYKPNKADWLEGAWLGLEVASSDEWRAETGVPLDQLKAIGKVLTTVPSDITVHKTLARIVAAKRKMFETGEGIDWATAEALAFGALLEENFRVRLSGQDSGRGTFSQRHSVWVDQNDEHTYVPLSHVKNGEKFEVIDSMLSEAGVLGFEYGYSLAEPNALVLWEAQFGDFANGAQVIIDQFISSGESKWLRMSGLTMLLPHGYEGQGPEHSSARPERFLQQCAEDNMQVVNCTTPANYFHVLRRQMHRKFRKPLIIFTPKSLLRHKRAISFLRDLTPGTQFHRVFWDHAEAEPGSSIKLKKDREIKRVIMCSGKVYYDILDARDAKKQDDTYILRLEQLYPFPEKALIKELSRFPKAARVIWCQEEPKNMGYWTFVESFIEDMLGKINIAAKRPLYAGRAPAASPATGLASRHAREQAALVEAALTL